MPENRPNEDRYAGGTFIADAEPEFLHRKVKPVDDSVEAEAADRVARRRNVIEKLTAPPETFLEHAERIGLNVNVHEIKRGDGVVLRRHYSINFSDAELQEAESGK